MALSPGTRLGPYEILVPIGAGGMGEVYRAKDSRLDREVAVKVLPQRMAADPEAMARFEREAKAVAALSHPNILAIHDVGAEGGTAYTVTELLEGENLRARMGGSALPVRKALDFALQIARGLGAAHDKGIVHRDLKPENLFVTEDGRVKILDFGLAKFVTASGGDMTATPTVDAGTRPGAVMGSMGYMSPEQVRGLAVDHRSDIFSFGTILYEILSGAKAFDRETSADTMSAILKEDPPEISGINRSVSPALERVIRHCLEKNPAERFQSARDLAFNLEAVGSASGVGVGTGAGIAEGSSIGSEAAHVRRHIPMAFVLGMAAGLLVGVGLATWLEHAPPSAPPTLRYLSYSGLDREPSASSDGRLIAYTSTRDRWTQIWLKQYPGGDEVALTTGHNDSSPRISPDGAQVLFERSEPNGDSLFKIPVVGGEPRKLLDDAYDGDWSPDGKRIAFLRQKRVKEIASSIVGVVESTGAGAREIGRVDNGVLRGVRWSPDGRSIAATRMAAENLANSVFLIGADGRDPRALDPPPPRGLLSAVAWSGAGDSLVYSQSDSIATGGVGGGSGRLIRQEIASGRTETIMWIPIQTPVIDIFGNGSVILGATSLRENLHEVSLARGGATTAGVVAASQVRWLTRGNSTDRQPAYSPDGQWVLFSSNRSGNLDLWKLSTSTGAVRRITEDAADDWDPAFTPDGSHILWSSSRGGHFEIWICGADGTGARQLTDDGLDAENPTATRDGQWVIYNSTNPTKTGIWKIHLDGTGATRIVPGTWSTPDVSPDGAYVAFRTGAIPRTLQVARTADGALVRFVGEAYRDLLGCRSRWVPEGRSLVFTGTNEAGAVGLYIQDFDPDRDTSRTRRALTGFDSNSALESFGISPDGRRLVYSTIDEVDGLMLAEGLPGIEPPLRRP